MMNKKMSFVCRTAMAVIMGNADAANQMIADFLNEIGNKIADVSRQYDKSEWPFVIVAMRTVADALEGALDESGKALTKTLTNSILIDASEFKKQMEEEKDAGI